VKHEILQIRKAY